MQQLTQYTEVKPGLAGGATVPEHQKNPRFGPHVAPNCLSPNLIGADLGGFGSQLDLTTSLRSRVRGAETASLRVGQGHAWMEDRGR